MALLRYIEPISSLPYPRGMLSALILTQAIPEANKEVEKVRTGDTKHGSYTKYSSTKHAKIRKYANMEQLQQPKILQGSLRKE